MTIPTHPRRAAAIALAVLAVAAAGCGSDDTASDDSGADEPVAASVSLEEPADGATVSSPVTFTMAAEGVTIEPAGEVVEGAGHFHLLIDVDCMTPGEVIPGGDEYQHFGQGQTSTELELEPGEHTVCLQVADGAHSALDLTDEVTFTVE